MQRRSLFRESFRHQAITFPLFLAMFLPLAGLGPGCGLGPGLGPGTGSGGEEIPKSSNEKYAIFLL